MVLFESIRGFAAKACLSARQRTMRYEEDLGTDAIRRGFPQAPDARYRFFSYKKA